LKYFSEFEIAANRFALEAIHSDGLMLLDNTDQQIKDITQEMLYRLSGDWVPRPGYHARLADLNECYKNFGGHGVPLAAMGEDFLFEMVL
jgi:hypothetical protein